MPPAVAPDGRASPARRTATRAPALTEDRALRTCVFSGMNRENSTRAGDSRRFAM